ncbi:hypothetical protein Pan153_35000 [Gimesia panareensis]|uniref:Tetratricopeptide repeat protein n=1 Tax=Gimesia panareensis TaxID=2527978 RepID=A0A518FR57_9PLAN|nr:tetratricopeptide repeat protein [Gimesia panareensis]QDV18839.1 hypothetical protein Pan153_35000 [Gimesia panareensis]
MSNSSELERLQFLASSRKMEGDFAGALKARQSLEGFYDENFVDTIQQVQNLNQIANLSILLGDLMEAQRSSRKSVALSVSLPEETKATCLMLLSCVLAESEEFKEATVYAERAIEIFESIFGAENDFVAYRKHDLNRMRQESLGGYLD